MPRSALFAGIALVAMAGPVWAEEGLPRSVYVAPAEVKGWQEEGRVMRVAFPGVPFGYSGYRVWVEYLQKQ